MYDESQSQIKNTTNILPSIFPFFEEEKYSCIICNYNTYRKDNYNRHLLSIKHLNKTNTKTKTKTKTKENVHICHLCNYSCIQKSNYKIHLNSKKHIKNTKANVEDVNMIENKDNKDNKDNKNIDEFKNEIITTLMTQFSSILEENSKNVLAEQTKMMIEQKQMITEFANKPSNIITQNNNQTNNQQFNLNVFLNETCKDAMNLSEFLENLHVSMEDMEKTGELGFAKGMSRIIMNNLNAIDVYKRPIHCSDVKRETLYVKNNGVWEKETEERKRTKEVIYKISSLNVKQLLKWRDLPRNKGYDKSDHKKNDEFTNLVMEINKLREEEIDKVITAVSKHVAIDKEKEKVKMSGYLN
jgi:hypothetical protein